MRKIRDLWNAKHENWRSNDLRSRAQPTNFMVVAMCVFTRRFFALTSHWRVQNVIIAMSVNFALNFATISTVYNSAQLKYVCRRISFSRDAWDPGSMTNRSDTITGFQTSIIDRFRQSSYRLKANETYLQIIVFKVLKRRKHPKIFPQKMQNSQKLLSLKQ